MCAEHCQNYFCSLTTLCELLGRFRATIGLGVHDDACAPLLLRRSPRSERATERDGGAGYSRHVVRCYTVRSGGACSDLPLLALPREMAF